MISPAAAADQLARTLGKIRERAGDDRDVLRLVEAIERRPGVRKELSQKNRGGKSERWAAALERRNQALRQLRVKLCPTLTPPAAASLISTKFRRYETDRWPRERADLVAPFDEPERQFWLLLRDHAADGPKMPGVRQLATILDRQGG